MRGNDNLAIEFEAVKSTFMQKSGSKLIAVVERKKSGLEQSLELREVSVVGGAMRYTRHITAVIVCYIHNTIIISIHFIQLIDCVNNISIGLLHRVSKKVAHRTLRNIFAQG